MSDVDFRCCIRLARRGDVRAARFLLRAFTLLVEDGKPIPHDLLTYVAERLKSALKSEPKDMTRELGLTASRRGRSARLRYKQVAKDWKLADAVKEHIREGDTLEIAVEKVAEATDAKESTVKKAYLRIQKIDRERKQLFALDQSVAAEFDRAFAIPPAD